MTVPLLFGKMIPPAAAYCQHRSSAEGNRIRLMSRPSLFFFMDNGYAAEERGEDF